MRRYPVRPGSPPRAVAALLLAAGLILPGCGTAPRSVPVFPGVTWAGRAFIAAVVAEPGGRVRVTFGVELRNAGAIPARDVRVRLQTPDGREVEEAAVPLPRGPGGEEGYAAYLTVSMPRADLVGYAQQVRFVVSWREGGTRKEEVFLQGIGEVGMV